MGTQRVITVEVTVSNVPEHISDQQVIDRLAQGVGYGSLTWPEPRSQVLGARVVTDAAQEKDTPAEV